MILITGAAGFIGKYFVENFSKKYKVLAIDKKAILFDNENVVFVKGNIESTEFLEKLFKTYKIDVVIHLAAEKNLVVCEESYKVANTNIFASLCLLELSKKTKAHYIFMSSDQVFNGREGNYLEKTIPDPINYYGKCKAEVEKEASSYRKATICRTALVFGYIDDISDYNQDEVENQSEFVNHVVSRISLGRVIKLPKDEIISPTLVDLLFEQVDSIVENNLFGIFHCCGSEAISRYEFGRKIARHFKLDEKKIISIKGKKYRPKNVSLNINNSEKILKVKGLTIDEMLGMIMNDEVNISR